jgi:hypothetical protein
MNNELFPRKCGQFDKSVDNFVHIFCQIRKQYFMWTLNSSPESVDNMYTSVGNIVYTWKVMVNSTRKQYTWTVFLLTWKCGQFYLSVNNIVHSFYKLGAQYNITQKPVFTQKPT